RPPTATTTPSIDAAQAPSASRGPSKPGHHLGDDPLKTLPGAPADAEQPCVPEGAGDRTLHHVAHAAVELQAVVDHALDEIAGEQLRHADLLHRGLLAGEQVAGPVGEPARRLDGREAVDEAVP